jgi:hypothetical protein
MKALLGSVLVASLILIQPSEKRSSDRVDTKEFSYESLPMCKDTLVKITAEDPVFKEMPVKIKKKKKPRKIIYVTF